MGRSGSAIFVEADGPRLFRTGPVILEHPTLRNRWIIVQDSTMGVVFTGPSGVKINPPDYDGDVNLVALTGVVAIEVRALLFNVWGDFTAHVGATRLVAEQIGETWTMDPRWSGVPTPGGDYRTSLMWVHRVMFRDETVFVADPAVIEAAVRRLTGAAVPDIGVPIPGSSGR